MDNLEKLFEYIDSKEYYAVTIPFIPSNEFVELIRSLNILRGGMTVTEVDEVYISFGKTMSWARDDTKVIVKYLYEMGIPLSIDLLGWDAYRLRFHDDESTACIRYFPNKQGYEILGTLKEKESYEKLRQFTKVMVNV